MAVKTFESFNATECQPGLRTDETRKRDALLDTAHARALALRGNLDQDRNRTPEPKRFRSLRRTVAPSTLSTST